MVKKNNKNLGYYVVKAICPRDVP